MADSYLINISSQLLTLIIVSLLVGQAETILNNEEINSSRSSKINRDRRKEFEKMKSDCLMDCNTKLENLKESIVQEELELERKYLKFEENLRNK